MKTFLIKAILISASLFESIDIGLFLKNLTYTLSKSSGELKGSLFLTSSKSSASVVLLTSGAAGYACNQTEMKYSLFFHLFFSIFVYSTANFIFKQDGYVIISS